MNKKNLYYAFGVFLLAVAAMIAAMTATDFKYPKQSQGTLVFSQSYTAGESLNKIRLINPQETITLELQDNLWRVAEADGYYANTYLLNALLNNFNSSSFYSRQDAKTTDGFGEGTKIETYSGDVLQDSILLGKATPNHLYRFARLDNGQVWLISGNFDLPQERYSWLLQPILELPPSLIESIRFDKNGAMYGVSRSDEYLAFANAQTSNIKAFGILGSLANLVAQDVRAEQNFDKNNYVLSQQMEIVTFQGLILRFSFYEDTQGEIWISINLSTTPLPMSVINDYIRENNFLYAGWYFKLSPETQKLLTVNSLI